MKWRKITKIPRTSKYTFASKHFIVLSVETMLRLSFVLWSTHQTRKGTRQTKTKTLSCTAAVEDEKLTNLRPQINQHQISFCPLDQVQCLVTLLSSSPPPLQPLSASLEPFSTTQQLITAPALYSHGDYLSLHCGNFNHGQHSLNNILIFNM